MTQKIVPRWAIILGIGLGIVLAFIALEAAFFPNAPVHQVLAPEYARHLPLIRTTIFMTLMMHLLGGALLIFVGFLALWGMIRK